jgi:hypothetical protein
VVLTLVVHSILLFKQIQRKDREWLDRLAKDDRSARREVVS